MQVLQALVKGVQLQGEAMKQRADNDKEDIVSYLTTSERLVTAFEVKQERLAFKLAPCLSVKADKAYAALPVVDTSNYIKLKEAILRHYNIMNESYHQHFRSVKLNKGKSSHPI